MERDTWPRVSVIIPLYGQHRGVSSLGAVSRAWLAQDVSCEVVVAVAGPMEVPSATESNGDSSLRVVRADESTRAPGLLRNLAAQYARGPMLYLSDADVLPLGRDFLTRVLEVADTAAFSQPWMYRVVDDPGSTPVDLQAPEPASCCYVRTADHGRLQPHGDEQFITQLLAVGGVDIDAPTVVPPSEVLRQYPSNKLDWRVPFHWGGLMLERRLFTDLGGYCRRYYGWGCEDDDLLVKLVARHHLVRGWHVDPTLACLHYEHSYLYRGTPERVANIACYTERLTAGPAAMIEEDRAALVDSIAATHW